MVNIIPGICIASIITGMINDISNIVNVITGMCSIIINIINIITVTNIVDINTGKGTIVSV